MKRLAVFLLICSALYAQVTSLPQVKRIYVADLTGDQSAAAIRDLIISSLNSTKLFVLTDNPERADAILKGAAKDESYDETIDSSTAVNMHQNAGRSTSSNASNRMLGGGAGDDESHHIRDRKHQAFATVRLCNKDGDVLWSTTQESTGAKFHGASADVAQKVARQLAIDAERDAHPAPAAPEQH